MKLISGLVALFLPLASCAFAGTATPVAFAPAKPVDISLTADTGWRQDHFEWTIAGDQQGRHPNILSNLDWTHLEIIPVSLGAELRLRDHWRVQLGGSYGWIADGRNRDSDYDANNRQGEFSRSHGDTSGHTFDAAFAIGYDLPEVIQRVTLTPWIGLDYHQQHLTDQNGVQDVDTLFHEIGPFGRLHSTYEAEWRGVSLGLDAHLRTSNTTRIVLGARYELVTYYATADWNLRSDLTGFKHRANGDGWRLSAGYEWIPAPRWMLGLHADWSLFQTRAGTDHTDYSDGTSSETRLNEVKWTSVGVRASLTYRF